MSKTNKTNEKAAVIMNKTLNFLKHNVYYIIMGVCIIALATVITVAAVINSNKAKTEVPKEGEIVSPGPEEKNEIENKDEKVDTEKKEPEVEAPQEKVFYIAAPLDSYEEGQTFVNSQLVWNPTQKHWATHEGMDFKAEAGSAVKCVYDGVVESVTTDSFDGTVVTIDHKNGYKTVYKLLDSVTLKAGDSVKMGQVIGKVSKDALSEIKDGPHLHFEVYKDGERIDPNQFLLTGNK